jgi:hypothetical protein
MSRGSDGSEDMRPEYDIRGGIRGKYLERYRQGTGIQWRIVFEESPFVAGSTASTPWVGMITRPASYPVALPPSPKVQIGSSRHTLHEGQDPPRG